MNLDIVLSKFNTKACIVIRASRGEMTCYLKLILEADLEQLEKQVISKKRVADHGEVLTGKREVNAMLDLVKCMSSKHPDRWY